MRKVSFGILGIVAALILAPQALASTVTVTGGNTINVAESGNEINRVAVSYVAATDVYNVADTAANLTPTRDLHRGRRAHRELSGHRHQDDLRRRGYAMRLDLAGPGRSPGGHGNLDGGPGNDSINGHGTLVGDSATTRWLAPRRRQGPRRQRKGFARGR